MKETDLGLFGDTVTVERLDEVVEGLQDRIHWNLDISVLKFHDVDLDGILPVDGETAPAVSRAVFNFDRSAVRELEDILLQRKDIRAQKIHGLRPEELVKAFKFRPDEVTRYNKNLLMYGGASCLWESLKGNASTTPGNALCIFDNTNAAVGVGDSSTAAAATQTALQAGANRLRAAMDATYPTHTDATTSGAATITFRGTFTTGQANFAWLESGIFNSATDATGRMLNRIVQNLGTKVSGSWALVIAITLA